MKILNDLRISINDYSQEFIFPDFDTNFVKILYVSEIQSDSAFS
jgi:hypothetical protein